MKNKMWILFVVCYLCLTGCNNTRPTVLACVKTEDNQTIDYLLRFEGDKLLSFKTTTTMLFDDPDSLEITYSILLQFLNKSEVNGLVQSLVKEDNQVLLITEYDPTLYQDPSSVSLSGFDIDQATAKKELEIAGFLCKDS